MAGTGAAAALLVELPEQARGRIDRESHHNTCCLSLPVGHFRDGIQHRQPGVQCQEGRVFQRRCQLDLGKSAGGGIKSRDIHPASQRWSASVGAEPHPACRSRSTRVGGMQQHTPGADRVVNHQHSCDECLDKKNYPAAGRGVWHGPKTLEGTEEAGATHQDTSPPAERGTCKATDCRAPERAIDCPVGIHCRPSKQSTEQCPSPLAGATQP